MRPSGPLDGGASLCGNVALIASKASGVIEIEIMLRRPAYPERAPRAMRVLDPDGREVHSMGDGRLSAALSLETICAPGALKA
jgi:hypothetical protein